MRPGIHVCKLSSLVYYAGESSIRTTRIDQLVPDGRNRVDNPASQANMSHIADSSHDAPTLFHHPRQFKTTEQSNKCLESRNIFFGCLDKNNVEIRESGRKVLESWLIRPACSSIGVSSTRIRSCTEESGGSRAQG